MGRKVDLTGQRFGELVVIKDVGRKNGMVLWECLCDCGKHTNIVSSSLARGNTKSCGCMTTKVDLTGQRFGKLVVVGEVAERSVAGRIKWLCLCDCGNYTEVGANNLPNGHTKSCGCFGGSKYLVGKRFGKLTVTKQLEKRCFRNIVWECLCDCGSVTEVSTNALKNGNTKSCGCLQYPCGADHPRHNPNLTEEERLKNRYQLSGGNSRVWSQQVMRRDNYTCQICGDSPSGNLNSHHLNGWNAFPEQRFDLDNGVTLCTDCHKEFHSQYGYGDNTREQFDEYAASKTLVLN